MSGRCLACGHEGVHSVLSLGEMPLANSLPPDLETAEREARYPLELGFCSRCALAQITESVAPELLFGEYPYFSSYSDTMLAHAEEIVDRMIAERSLGPSTLAMEIASNDGYLLQFYVRRGVPALGIEPARNVAAVASERGIDTLCAFFGAELAYELRREGRRAAVLHANNVLAHVPDVNGVVRGIGQVLTDGGLAVIEVPYVRDLVDRLEFDTIYHEHLFYYSLSALDRLLTRNGLRVVDVERIPIHGGSLRVYATGADTACNSSPAVDALLDEEERIGLTSLSYFRDFADRVRTLRDELLALLVDLKGRGHRLAAYGAAAKGATLLNTVGIGRDLLDFVADRSEHKRGRLMPGVHVPIVGPDRLLAEMPDDVLLLAWNFADEILAQQAEYRRRGGRFVIPVPAPQIV
jgi:SAM-dependent methyltransferase